MSQDLDLRTNPYRLSRLLGGLSALVYPTLLVVLALATGFRRTGDYADLAVSFLAVLLLLIALPTAWIFSLEFIDPDRFTILFVGSLTSFPLWYLVGSAVAARMQRWSRWVSRYLLLCVLWTLSNLVIVILVAWLAG